MRPASPPPTIETRKGALEYDGIEDRHVDVGLVEEERVEGGVRLGCQPDEAVERLDVSIILAVE